MPRPLIIISALALLLPALASCGHPGGDQPDPAPRAVIEGWIDDDGYPVVIFTASFVPDEGNVTIADKVIRWGKVTVSDGTREVVLTGSPDKRFFPPFVYRSYELQGRPGATYTLRADYLDLHAEAVCTMPPAIPPGSVEVRESPVEGSDSLRSATLLITAPDDCPAYYHVSVSVRPDDRRYYPGMMGCVAATRPGEVVELPVFRGKTSLSADDFVPQLPRHSDVSIRLERVSGEVYRFWEAFNEATLFGGSQFVSHFTSLPGNVEGGFGVWSARSSMVILLRAEPER